MNICQKTIDDVTNADAKVKDILMMGDFNLPCISWPSGKIYDRQVGKKSKEKQQAEILVNAVESNFMENYINTATRQKYAWSGVLKQPQACEWLHNNR